MPRPHRADEAGGLYHALNRANGRRRIFRKDADYDAFERVLAAGLQRYAVELYAYQLMPNHWHLVLRAGRNGEMSRFMRWITATHTMRHHAHYHTAGQGHLYQGRFKSFPIQDDAHFLAVCRYVERNAVRAQLARRAEQWRWGSLWRWRQRVEPAPQLLSAWPIPRSAQWMANVNKPLARSELERLRHAAQRGTPYGEAAWVETTARRLKLDSTLRPRGRPRVRLNNQ
ncbi:MAG: transposase [Planctomycetes bacterium]|nr:transposase [Planctomycetota bacterium]